MNSTFNDDVISCKLKENHGSSSHRIDEIKDGELQSGLNADCGSARHKHGSFSFMLQWLKSVAVDHHKAYTLSRNTKESVGQILNARKVLSLSHDAAPWRKRKLDQLQQKTVTDASDLPLKKPNERSSTKRGTISTASSFSSLISFADSEGSSDQTPNAHCSVRSLKFVDNLSQKRILNGHSLQPNALLDSDDSVGGSNISCSTNPIIRASHNRPLKLLKSGNNDPRKQVHRPYKKASPMYRSDEYVKGSNLSSTTSQMSSEVFDIFGEDGDLSRMAIPVGPRFQADIPDLIVELNMDSSAHGDAKSDDTEKWVGTCIWPIQGMNVNVIGENIGKGRPSSCSCHSPGSMQCIKLHITEKRLQLHSGLSSAFVSWKFDEMGEEVSKLWTLEEQKRFRILVKMNPVSEEKSFWKPALKSFPTKSRESLVSYYFNVFVLRRMSRQTRMASEAVDSDDDETDEGVGHFKAPKQRYLTGVR